MPWIRFKGCCFDRWIFGELLESGHSDNRNIHRTLGFIGFMVMTPEYGAASQLEKIE